MLRSTDDIETTFASTCQVLDRLLAEARPALEAAGVAIIDRSNRSCFDWTGYPTCKWDLRFDRQVPHGSETALAAARLVYYEPLDDTATRELVAVSIAEIYQTGKPSRVEDRVEHRIPVALIEAALGDFVERLLRGAWDRLAVHGVSVP